MLLGLTTFSLVGCKKDFLDINRDPNNPEYVEPRLVLPAGQASAAVIIGGTLFNTASIWSQYFTQHPLAAQYKREDDYSITTDYLDNVWTESYAGALNDLQKVRENGHVGYKLVAAALQGYIYQVLVDAVDKVPYSEALKGGDLLNPKFDNGEDVYDAIINDLNAAIAAYEADPERVDASTDMIFGGDMENWVRFANTLKLKMYMRASNSAKANPAAIRELVAEGRLLNVDAAFSKFEEGMNYQNPFYAINVSSQLGNVNHVASQSFLYFLLENDDPRVSTVYKYANNQTQYIGNKQGDYNINNAPFVATLSRLNFAATTPVYFFTKYEIDFLLAEAAVRFGTGDDAQALYEKGIADNFALRGVSGAADLYADGGPYAFPAGEAAQLEAIYTQKWAAMAMLQNYEAWTEIRRTGVPAHVTGTETVPGKLLISQTTNLPAGQAPNRFFYPDVAVSRNPNTPGQPTFISEKIWWAK